MLESRSNMEDRRRWHTRGYLPHFDGDVCQFITFRLADSLPQTVLVQFEQELEADKLKRFYSREKQIKIEEFLDRGVGECLLGVPELAQIVMDALYHFECERYKSFSFVIMPNHVHWLMRPMPTWTLSEIMKSVKGNTAFLINKHLGRKGAVWMPDYFDRYIRDSEHFEKAVRYIENNPVNAGLCELPEEWLFSSAHPVMRARLRG